MTTQRETLLLLGALIIPAALFPLFFTGAGNQEPNAPSKPIPIRAIAPYLVAIPRAIIAVPAKPVGFVAYYAILVATPALVVLDALFSLILLPFRALAVVLRALYPIYVLCGAATLTGAILGGSVVGFVKLVLLIQEVRRNRRDVVEYREWKTEKRSIPVRERYHR